MELTAPNRQQLITGLYRLNDEVVQIHPHHHDARQKKQNNTRRLLRDTLYPGEIQSYKQSRIGLYPQAGYLKRIVNHSANQPHQHPGAHFKKNDTQHVRHSH